MITRTRPSPSARGMAVASTLSRTKPSRSGFAAHAASQCGSEGKRSDIRKCTSWPRRAIASLKTIAGPPAPAQRSSTFEVPAFDSSAASGSTRPSLKRPQRMARDSASVSVSRNTAGAHAASLNSKS
jgi:hypothetical protein